MMIVPAYLKKGDKIRIVAPAGRIKTEFVQTGVEWLRGEGYKVVLGKHVLDEYNPFAGKDEDRFNDFQEALDDFETSAIICARGGYGSVRIIDKLDFSRFLKNPKWIVGFSDITVFHNRLNNLSIASVHGPMLRHFPKSGKKVSESVKSLFSTLRGEKLVYETRGAKLNKVGKVKAELIGGNLSIINSLSGTPFDLKINGKILFIEDVGEHHYRLDRIIQNLKLSGRLKKLAGLVVGDFTLMKDDKSDFGMDIQQIIFEAVKEYNYPVCFGFPAGHAKKNLALALGMNWELKVGESGASIKML